MDAKRIGLIALIVVGVLGAAWSFKSSFMSGPAPAGQDQAAKWRAIMQKQGQQGQQARGHSPAPK